jgi:hypothetical protein
VIAAAKTNGRSLPTAFVNVTIAPSRASAPADRVDEVTYSARGRGDREQEIVKTISFRGCIAMAGLCHGGMLDGKRYFLDQRKSQGKS